MPSFENYPVNSLIKLLLMGDTGAGKTGSLVALASAGYNVRILDLDNGAEVIKDFVTNPASPYLRPKPGLWDAEQANGTTKRMRYVPITEGVNILNGKPVPKGDSWTKLNNQLNKWTDGEQDLGNVGSWTDQDVLVVDGLSRLAASAFNFQLKMNGRLGARPEQSDWWQSQNLIESLLLMLQGTETPCHVIVICHITYIETDSGPTRGFPQTIGKALSPKIGQFFNHTLMMRSQGQGIQVKRKILTNTAGMVELKNPAPLRVKAEYDIETGLAEYFRDVRGGRA